MYFTPSEFNKYWRENSLQKAKARGEVLWSSGLLGEVEIDLTVPDKNKGGVGNQGYKNH